MLLPNVGLNYHITRCHKHEAHVRNMLTAVCYL